MSRAQLVHAAIVGTAVSLLAACSAPPSAAQWPHHDDDPAKVVQDARSHEEAGAYAEALDQYLWALDNGVEVDDTFVGARVRLPDAILRLGAKYPPALAALKERHRLLALRIRNASESLGTVDPTDLALFVRLGRKLGDEETTKATYGVVKGRLPPDSALRRDLWMEMADQLIETRRYAEAAKEHDVSLADVRFHIGIYKRITPANERDQPILRDTIEFMVRRAAGHYEALVGSGDATTAELFANELIEFRPTAATFSVLIEHALRAGAADAAAALRARAHAVIPEGDRPIVDKAGGPEKGS